MTESHCRKLGFKKCRSATFSIDGFSFTIGKVVAPGVAPVQQVLGGQTRLILDKGSAQAHFS